MNHLPKVGLLILYLALAATTTQILHFSRALDEGYHLELITFIKQNGRLPITYEEREAMARADLPPLYHVVVSVASAGVPINPYPTFKNYYDSFRYRAIDVQTDQPWTLHTEDLTRPYLGRFWVWQVGRWLSVGLSVMTLIVIYLTLQVMPLGQRPLTSLAGAAIMAFTPRFLLVNAALNDDSLLGMTAALYFLFLVWLIKQPQNWWPVIGVGVMLGISATVKYALALMPLELIIVLGLIARRQKLGARWWLGRLAVAGGATIVCSSWWFGWNLWHFNTIAQDGLLVGSVRALLAGGYNATLNQIGDALTGGQLASRPGVEATPPGTLSSWVMTTFRSFWGYDIEGRVPLSALGFPFVGGLLVLAAFGLGRLWRRLSEFRPWILLAGGHVLLLIIIPLVRFATSGRLGQTAQGRHILIPAAAAVAALLVWGVAEITPRRWQGPVFGGIIAAFIGWSGLHLNLLANPAISPLPMRTVAQAAEWLPQPVKAQFGSEHEIELVTFRLEPQPAQGQLTVELAWRSRIAVNVNYRLRVTLLSQAGQPVSVWEGYHGAGRLPTLAWEPGDVVFDRLRLPLPTLPAGRYAVQVQLIGPNEQPLPVRQNGLDQTVLTLAETSVAEPSTLVVGEAGLMIWPPEAVSLRYPGTVVIVVTDPSTKVDLVDPNGTVWPPDVAANGVFNFVVGPRWPSGAYDIRLNGQTTGATTLVENWWPRQFVPPDDIETLLPANFAEQVQLLGYSLPQKQVKAGESFPITLYWQAPADKSPQANFIQFNNLLDSSGTLHGGYDRLPLEYYSTLLWAPAEVVVDGYTVPVEADASPGEYWLDVGLYLTVGEAAVNLPLVVDGQRSPVSSVTIGPIEVVAP